MSNQINRTLIGFLCIYQLYIKNFMKMSLRPDCMVSYKKKQKIMSKSKQVKIATLILRTFKHTYLSVMLKISLSHTPARVQPENNGQLVYQEL